MAEQFRDEGKKQEALIRQNKKNVEQNLETAKKANKRIEEVLLLSSRFMVHDILFCRSRMRLEARGQEESVFMWYLSS